MHIPPFGESRLPPFFSEKLSAQQEFLTQFELLTQIQTQMTQNRGKGEILEGLRREFEETLDQIQERLSALSPSCTASVLGTLDALQGQLHQLARHLHRSSPQDTIQQSSATVATLITRLQQELLPQRLR